VSLPTRYVEMAVHEACCRRREASKGSGSRAPLLGLFLPFIVGACASVPLEQKGALSYQHLAPSDGLLTKAQVSVNKDEVLAAGTIRIMPTTFSATATEARLSDVQLRLIANAVDRSLCGGLSDRFPQAAQLSPVLDQRQRRPIRRSAPRQRDVLEPEPQHRAVAGESKIAQLLRQRDRLARDDILRNSGGRVDPRRAPGGIAGFALDPGTAARPELIGRRRRLRRRRMITERLFFRPLPLFRPDFDFTFDVHRS